MRGKPKSADVLPRRQFLSIPPIIVTAGVGSAWPSMSRASEQPGKRVALEGELGVTTGSFVRHLTEEPQEGKLRLLDLPQVMREELDMRIIDLMTATLPSLEPDYLRRLREASEKAGCVLTNLKMNQPGLNLGSEDADERRRAIDEYKRTIDAAALLGVRWVRPLPGPKRPDLANLAAGYRELIEYAAPRGISLLVENYGWLASDASAIPDLLERFHFRCGGYWHLLAASSWKNSNEYLDSISR